MAASKLSKDLGYGMPISSIISSASFVVCLFFYLYVIGSFFKITVYPLIDRATFDAVFQEYIVNEYVDNIVAIVAATLWFLFSINNRAIRYSLSIAYGATGATLALITPNNIIFDIITLLSIPLIIGVSLYYHYYYPRYHRDHNQQHQQRQKKNILLNFNGKLTLQYISLAVIAFSAIGIVVQISAIFLIPNLDSSAGEDPANELFLLLSSFSTIYIFLLVFCLAVKVLFKDASRRLKLDIKEDISYQTLSDDDDYYKQNKLKNTKTKIGVLLIAILLSLFLVLIPQHPLINKDNQYIGVDTRQYAIWISELTKSKNLSDLIYQSFVVQGNGDRPLSLLFLFSVYQVAVGGDNNSNSNSNNNLTEVIEHFPLILGPGIVLAFYFLTIELTRNEKIALIAAFLGAVSFHTLVGIYAGFYANWLALIIGYISIAFLFRYLRTGRHFDIILFSALLIGVLLFHVYTWTALTAVAGVFLVVMLLVAIWNKKKNKDISNSNHFTNRRRRIIWLLLAILISIGVDIAKVSLTGSSGGLEQDIEVAQRSLGIEQFNLRFQILDSTMHHGFGGVFSNFIILLLGLFWVLKSNMREPGTIFLMIFLSTGLVPLFFGNSIVQTRIFYDMPFEIPAAIALYYISSRSGSSILVTLAACTWLVAVSLVTVINFYFIPVPGVQ